MLLKLKKASLIYGMRRYPIAPNPTAPLQDFDFEHKEECVYHTMAVLSNQSGGHELNSARLYIAKDRSYVRLSGNGFEAVWGQMKPLTIPPGATTEEIAALANEQIAFWEAENVPFGVASDQYGEGWKRARRTPAKPFNPLEVEKATTVEKPTPRWRR